MTETTMVKSWPSGLDKGAELQFSLLEYTQPPARESPKEQQDSTSSNDTTSDTTNDKQTSKSEDHVETNPPEGSGSTVEKNGNDEEGTVNSDNKEKGTDEKPEEKSQEETPTLDDEKQKSDEEEAATPNSDGDNDTTDTLNLRAPTPDPSVDYPKWYYEAPDLKVVIRCKADDPAFMVSSHALSIASKVWRHALAPQNIKKLESEPFNGSTEGTINVLYLDDIDPLSLDILFRVIHWKTDDLPQTLSFDALRKLAITCDKFDCGRVLNPWHLLWMEEYEAKATLPGFEDWIFIAHVLDTRNAKVEEISRKLILEVSSISKCGTYLRRDVRGFGIAAHTTEVEVGLIPAGILEHVLQERRNAIEEIITMLRLFVGNITSADEEPGSFGLAETNFCQNEACSHMALGSLIRSLKNLGLWPLLRPGAPHEWHGSVTTLVMQIEVIRMITLLQKGEVPNTLEISANKENSTGAGPQLPKKNPSKLLNPLAPGKRVSRQPSPGPSKGPTISRQSARGTTQSQRIRAGAYGKVRSIFDVFELSPEVQQGEKNPDSSTKDEPKHSSKPSLPPPLIRSNSFNNNLSAFMSEYPAFEGANYPDDHYPCASAFALGELITNCRRIVAEISADSYKPSA